jgi:Ribbon-helix-helix protein, copG family
MDLIWTLSSRVSAIVGDSAIVRDIAGPTENQTQVGSDGVRANTVRMPEDLWAALDAEAKRTGQSQGELIRQAVALHLAFLAAVRHGGDVAGLLDEMLRRVEA